MEEEEGGGSAGSEEKEQRGCWESVVSVGLGRAGRRPRRRVGVAVEEEEANAAARVVRAVAALGWGWTRRTAARRRKWMKACILERVRRCVMRA